MAEEEHSEYDKDGEETQSNNNTQTYPKKEEKKETKWIVRKSQVVECTKNGLNRSVLTEYFDQPRENGLIDRISVSDGQDKVDAVCDDQGEEYLLEIIEEEWISYEPVILTDDLKELTEVPLSDELNEVPLNVELSGVLLNEEQRKVPLNEEMNEVLLSDELSDVQDENQLNNDANKCVMCEELSLGDEQNEVSLNEELNKIQLNGELNIVFLNEEQNEVPLNEELHDVPLSEELTNVPVNEDFSEVNFETGQGEILPEYEVCEKVQDKEGILSNKLEMLDSTDCVDGRNDSPNSQEVFYECVEELVNKNHEIFIERKESGVQLRNSGVVLEQQTEYAKELVSNNSPKTILYERNGYVGEQLNKFQVLNEQSRYVDGQVDNREEVFEDVDKNHNCVGEYIGHGEPGTEGYELDGLALEATQGTLKINIPDALVYCAWKRHRRVTCLSVSFKRHVFTLFAN